MKKSLIYVVPIALMAAQAVAASPAGWGGMATHDRGTATAGSEAAPLVLVGYRGGVVAPTSTERMSAAQMSAGPMSTGPTSTAIASTETFRRTGT